VQQVGMAQGRLEELLVIACRAFHLPLVTTLLPNWTHQRPR
jgi:hypothetical protein